MRRLLKRAIASVVFALIALGVAAGSSTALSAELTLENPHYILMPATGSLVYRLDITTGDAFEQLDLTVGNGVLSGPTGKGEISVSGPGQVRPGSWLVPLTHRPCRGKWPREFRGYPAYSLLEADLPAKSTTSIQFSYTYGDTPPFPGAGFAPSITIHRRHGQGDGTPVPTVNAPEPDWSTQIWRVRLPYWSRKEGMGCPTPVRIGGVIRMRGKTSPPTPYQRIDLMAHRFANGPPREFTEKMGFKPVASTVAGPDGSWSFVYRTHSQGLYVFKPRYVSQQPLLLTSSGKWSYFTIGDVPGVYRRWRVTP